MAGKEYLYPLWLRIWHGLNALLFIILIFTGLNLQYASEGSVMIGFKNAVALHNAAGILLSINYLLFIVLNFTSGNYKNYIPKINGFVKRSILQIKYYVHGIFHNHPHPFEISKEQKFNPLQQITYLKIMYLLLPVLIISGWGMLFPEIILKDFFGTAGMLITAVIHTGAGFILSVFMLGHIYLASTGTTISSNYKAMVTGWHEHHD